MGATAETTVTVEFRELGAGTELLLEHGPFPEPPIRALHAQGWRTASGDSTSCCKTLMHPGLDRVLFFV